jgi:hypothetical protein
MAEFSCRADCGRSIEWDEMICIEENPGRYLDGSRFHVWHQRCHPDVVNREFRKICKRITLTGTCLE